jgi:hypothetical protein
MSFAGLFDVSIGLSVDWLVIVSADLLRTLNWKTKLKRKGIPTTKNTVSVLFNETRTTGGKSNK